MCGRHLGEESSRRARGSAALHQKEMERASKVTRDFLALTSGAAFAEGLSLRDALKRSKGKAIDIFRSLRVGEIAILDVVRHNEHYKLELLLEERPRFRMRR